jgi:hypothetical protein
MATLKTNRLSEKAKNAAVKVKGGRAYVKSGAALGTLLTPSGWRVDMPKTAQPIPAAKHSYCIVTLGQNGATYWRYSDGELTEFHRQPFELDTTQWKRKDQSHAAERGMRLPHGAQRDIFNRRVKDELSRFLHSVAKETVDQTRRNHLEAAFIVGAERLIGSVVRGFPRNFSNHVAIIHHDLAGISAAELRRHIEPEIAKWEAAQQSKLVTELLAAETGVTLGIDETLARLEKGEIRTLVISEGLEANLRKCIKCGLASRAADPVCACGGERRWTKLSEILPELIGKRGVEVVIITGKDAERLASLDGMGGWLRFKARPAHA